MRSRILNNPGSYPASNNFASMPDLQTWNTKRKYIKAFPFTTSAGPNVFENIQFPGKARFFLGLTIWDDTLDVQNNFSLNLNNDDIITTGSWAEFCKVRFSGVGGAAADVLGTSFNGEFYPFPRALNGNDSIKLTYNANTAGHISLSCYFKNDLDIF